MINIPTTIFVTLSLTAHPNMLTFHVLVRKLYIVRFGSIVILSMFLYRAAVNQALSLYREAKL